MDKKKPIKKRHLTGKVAEIAKEVTPESLEEARKKLIAEEEYWQDVRERAAIAAMGQLIGMGRDDGYKYSPSDVANYAVVYANALIEELKNQ